VRVDFEGGQLSSDGGVALVAELERQQGIVRRFAACFVAHREPASTEHAVGTLVAQRVFGLVLGYEDLNDHEQLRGDPLLAAAVGLADPTGGARRCARDRGKPLAGKSTLQRSRAHRRAPPVGSASPTAAASNESPRSCSWSFRSS